MKPSFIPDSSSLKPVVWLLALGLAGCASVPVSDQRLVAKPNMQFSRSTVFSYSSKLMPQVQPGLAASGGAQPSTCTLCR